MNNYIRYYDERFGDVYEIFVNHDGDFLTASRSLEAFGRNPIYYDDIDEIPAIHRVAIEHLLAERKKKK